ncbi:hypothetical protein FOZ62_000588 [Perkinsus olseni]|uniref:Uncharacterized protein n=1 Tax=Perkinsus olseni TaxID=32597 RepID=A0A7J6PWA5_PEROL|nr:hypothetical protein FOZ62_000588 [Perkinsus olseni]
MSGVAPPSSGRSRELRSATRKGSIHSSVSSLGAEDSFVLLKSPRAGLASLGYTTDQAFSTVRAAAAAQHAGVGGGFITLLEELMELSDVRRLERRSPSISSTPMKAISPPSKSSLPPSSARSTVPSARTTNASIKRDYPQPPLSNRSAPATARSSRRLTLYSRPLGLRSSSLGPTTGGTRNRPSPPDHSAKWR